MADESKEVCFSIPESRLRLWLEKAISIMNPQVLYDENQLKMAHDVIAKNQRDVSIIEADLFNLLNGENENKFS